MTETATLARTLNQTESLQQAWADLKRAQPGLRIRDAAKLLSVSEMALLLTENYQQVTPLNFDHGLALLQQLPNLGEIMALTRNDACVHERTGVFDQPKGNEKMALTLGVQDQRYFLGQWRFYLHVQDQKRESIQVFDINGHALWKLFTTAKTDFSAWRTLTNAHRNAQPIVAPQSREKKIASNSRASNPESNAVSQAQQALLERWSKLSDVHEFHGILKDLQLTRPQAYEIAQNQWTQKLANHSAEQLLIEAQVQHSPLMIFTGNHGLIQIYTGTIHNLRRTGYWFNVLDPSFNLHLNTDKVVETWRIARPTKDGTIHSIECFDAEGTSIVTFFGERHEGEAERQDWRDNIDRLEGAL